MKKKLTTVKFQGTAEQEQKLLAVIEEYKNVQGAMMSVLQKAQDIYGYLPLEVQRMIALRMGISVEEVTVFPHSTHSSFLTPRVTLLLPFVWVLRAM
jgi:NADH:ubiquinone oxidoreductase subunit E